MDICATLIFSFWDCFWISSGSEWGGGRITISNLSGEIEVSPKTGKAWLELLERMYLVFAVRPFTRSLSRAIVKPPKVYFFDNADVIGDEGARFENLKDYAA